MGLKYEVHVNLCWIYPLHHCSTISERKLMTNLVNLTCLLRWGRRLGAITFKLLLRSFGGTTHAVAWPIISEGLFVCNFNMHSMNQCLIFIAWNSALKAASLFSNNRVHSFVRLMINLLKERQTNFAIVTTGGYN